MPIEHTPSDEAGYPPTCEIKNWRVFNDGFHKGQLYSLSEIQQLADNFDRIRRWRTPKVGIGHDRGQRLAASLGVPNSGHVVGCRHDGRGNLDLDLANVPTWLGAQVNAGRYDDGSVELKKDFRPTDDPAHPVPGSYLDGIAILGEEQPAVPQDRTKHPPPKAVFADGREVPPSWDPVSVPKGPLSPPQPVAGAHSALCFSDDHTPAVETQPVNEDQMYAAFSSLPDEAKKAFMAKCMAQVAPPAEGGAGAPGAAPPPPNPAGGQMAVGDGSGNQRGQEQAMNIKDTGKSIYQSDDNDIGKKLDAMSSAFSAKFSDIEKRMSAYDAKFSEDKAKDEAAEMAAFSDRVDTRCKALAGRVEPVVIEKSIKPAALDILRSKHFSGDAEREGAFNALFTRYESLPVDRRLADTLQDRPQPGAHTNPYLAAAAAPGGVLEKVLPATARAIREKAATA